jgi:hypothetical protein
MRDCRIFDAEPRGLFHQVGKRFRCHLLHHLASMCLNRDFTGAELVAAGFRKRA